MTESWKTVERVLDERETTNEVGARETEFYIKWSSEWSNVPADASAEGRSDLQYSDSTWENYPAVEPLPTFKPALDDFHERQRRTTTPARSIAYPIDGRPAYRKIEDDPDYIKATGGQLKPFQLTGLNWLLYLWSKGENGVLADEVSDPRSQYPTDTRRWVSVRPSSRLRTYPTFTTLCNNTGHIWSWFPYPPFPPGNRNSAIGHPI